MKLYRPVGLYEMEKILDSNGKEFPPRFPEQPIFYPVLNISYAQQIAREWNQNDPHSGFVGFVTEFDIEEEYVKNYESHCVGDTVHQELWIPSEKLEEFNKHINNGIKIIEAYYGNQYTGIKPCGLSGFKEDMIDKQLDIFKNLLSYNLLDFSGTVFVEWKLINLNFLYWTIDLENNKSILNAINTSLLKNNKQFVKNHNFNSTLSNSVGS